MPEARIAYRAKSRLTPQLSAAEKSISNDAASPEASIVHAAPGLASPDPETGSLRQAMANVDLQQAIEELAADDNRDFNTLDEILAAEIDNTHDFRSQADVADHRRSNEAHPADPWNDPASMDEPTDATTQLLLGKIVKARDALWIEQRLAALESSLLEIDRHAPPDPLLPSTPSEHQNPMPEQTVATVSHSATARRLALFGGIAAILVIAALSLAVDDVSRFTAAFTRTAETSGQALANETGAPAPPREIAITQAVGLQQPQITPPAASSQNEARNAAQNAALSERFSTPSQDSGNADPLNLQLSQKLQKINALRMQSGTAAANDERTSSLAAQNSLPLARAAMLPAGKDQSRVTDIEPDDAPQLSGTLVEADAKQGREPQDIDSALARTHGLEGLAPLQIAALKQKLMSGECPSAALASLLGKAPIVATRDLVRNLKNGC